MTPPRTATELSVIVGQRTLLFPMGSKNATIFKRMVPSGSASGGRNNRLLGRHSFRCCVAPRAGDRFNNRPVRIADRIPQNPHPGQILAVVRCVLCRSRFSPLAIV